MGANEITFVGEVKVFCLPHGMFHRGGRPLRLDRQERACGDTWDELERDSPRMNVYHDEVIAGDNREIMSRTHLLSPRVSRFARPRQPQEPAQHSAASGRRCWLRCWILEPVNQFDQVRREPLAPGKTTRFGPAFPLCVEKQFQLPLA